MSSPTLTSAIAGIPKAELHLHLEGAIAPETVVLLAARHGTEVTAREVSERYRYSNFRGFLNAYKWVTSFLREPDDYHLIADELFDSLLRQNVIYVEITLSAGVMLLRGQDVGANFSAVRQAAERAGRQGLRVQWILDAVRQFGPDAAMETARWAVRLAPEGVVAFGIGGDEMAVPVSQLRPVYEFARAGGLHLLAHAGEIGGPEAVREAIEVLGVERIGHGLAVLHDPYLMDRLAESGLPLEICPTSNLRTGALDRQLAAAGAPIESHPLKSFFDRGLRVTLSTDDPAMFETDLAGEYEAAARMGFSAAELARLVEMSFTSAFLPEADRRDYIDQVHWQAKRLGLL